MISLVRNRLGIPGLIAIIAMVFAMGGAAYAAKKYVITSTSQIKPSVLKKLKGKRGPQGPAGTNGTNGKDGANGTNGAPGAPGADGASVVLLNESPASCIEGGFTYEIEGSGEETEVCNGEEGSPWTAGGVLPSGKTETGTYGVIGHFTKNYSENGSGELESTTSPSPMIAQISFTLPVDPAPTEAIYVSGASATHCPGIQGGVATADAGYLCVYQGPGTNPPSLAPFFSPGMTFGSVLGADQMGTEMFAECPVATCTMAGAWAVTAE